MKGLMLQAFLPLTANERTAVRYVVKGMESKPQSRDTAQDICVTGLP